MTAEAMLRPSNGNARWERHLAAARRTISFALPPQPDECRDNERYASAEKSPGEEDIFRHGHAPSPYPLPMAFFTASRQGHCQPARRRRAQYCGLTRAALTGAYSKASLARLFITRDAS